MEEEKLAEMWESSEDSPMPDGFLRTVRSYFRSKSAMGPVGFDAGDFATCVMLWKLAMAVKGGERSKVKHG